MSGLSYIESFARGYMRQRVCDKWVYRTLRGKIVTAKHIVDRLNAIGVPPAYTDVWLCASANGHIQAIGHDAKGRRQYRYHPAFLAQQDEAKYGRCLAFGHALPVIRKQVERDLARRDMSHERVVAAIIRLLDLGKVRVGNHAYARQNKSFGATTLRNRHAKITGKRILLDYVGKAGKIQRISIEDRRLSTVVRQCQEMPGQALFQYYDQNDSDRHPVSSTDVNDYLREHSGGFTAKDFRTWGASVIAFGALTRAKGETSLKFLLEEVARQLGNTPAIARKSYVHPAIIEAAQGKGAPNSWRLPRATKFLQSDERGLIAFLEQYAKQADGGSLGQNL